MRVKRGVRGRISELLRKRSSSTGFRASVIVTIALLLLTVSLLVIQVTRAAPPCPCNVFTPSQPSTEPGVFSQPGGIEVGFKFKVDQDGYISGVRFYKAAGMGGTHIASLWDTFGQRIAQATFVGETSAGWQQVDFGPVAVSASSIYTASVWMADGQYPATPNFFTVDINNSPLFVPRDGTAFDAGGRRGQGVYNDSGSSLYPGQWFNATNYWVDVSYVGSTSELPPSVTAKTPVADAIDIPLTDNTVTATFDTAMDPSTVVAGSLVVKDSQNNTVSGTMTYNSTTFTVKFEADAIWQAGEVYTVTLEGDTSPSAVTDLQGRALAVDNVWTFNASTTPLGCPCTFKNRQNPSGSETFRNPSPTGLEIGLKVVPKANGYITALRFYKPIINPDTTHTGNIWDKDGVSLATVTYSNESDYGWQEASLATPLYVTKDTLYIISYGTMTPHIQANVGAFSQPMISPGLVAYPLGDARNMAAGSGLANAVYATTAGTYPSINDDSQADYYVDAVFVLSSDETTPLQVSGTQPSDKSYGVSRTIISTATFDGALDGTTVNNTTVKAYDSQNTLVSGTVAYDSSKWAITFTPASPLAYNATYTVRLDAQIKDTRGVSLAADHSWSFTTGGPPATDMNQGNGGPILVVTTTDSPYGKYYAEILRTEGLNYFDVKDSTLLSSAELENYTTVVLAEMTLTQSQVDMLSVWVNDGGSLVAMRPDKKLAGILGLTDAGSSSSNQYLRTNVASTAGMGIVDETIQFKGVADNYIRSGADAVATLYSDAFTPTSYPAATTRTVGKGTAMAFSYDLAQSVIALHQGNKAWSAQDRDGDGIIRSVDLFYGPRLGDVQLDWLDSTKMQIPQADEQQRLFANMITTAMSKHLPAPRFWYLPDTQKAALVLAGDDHSLANDRGTEQTVNNWLNESETGCSVQDWQCVRASHYVYNNGPLTNVRAAQYDSYGFEVANHPSGLDGSCPIYGSYESLNTRYSTDLANWQAVYLSLPNQSTARFHCYIWSDWDMMARVDTANGIRYDLNYVAYPAAMVGTDSPLVTGSGMNMRLTDASGAMLDVRQGVTNFDNLSAGAPSIAATFDNAIGASGYYGLFGSHYDMNDSYDRTLVSVAKSRNIPMISAEQALVWLDGRNSSNFSNLTSSQTGKISFTITTGEGAHGLQAMVPLSDGAGTLGTITLSGQTVTHRSEIVKGVQYAIFEARPGEYDVTYSDYVAPTPIAPVTPTVPPSAESPATNTDNNTSEGIVDNSPIAVVDIYAEQNDAAQQPDSSKNLVDDDGAVQPLDDIEEDGLPAVLVVSAGAAIVVVGSAIFWLLRLLRLSRQP